MGTFCKLEQFTLDDSKTVILCGKGHGYKMAPEFLERKLERCLVAAVNQAVLFFKRIDFMFCVDVNVLIDLKKREYDFSKVKNLVIPLHMADCQLLPIDDKEIDDSFGGLTDADSQLECLRLVSGFFPETTNIYTFQDKSRPCSYEIDNATHDCINIGGGYSTLNSAAQWLLLAGTREIRVFGTTPYPSVADGLEKTSTQKEELWYRLNFNRILHILESNQCDAWSVYTPQLQYHGEAVELRKRGIRIIDIANNKRSYFDMLMPIADGVARKYLD
jgi:hypothetical protein